jgi:acetyl-CoA C-acetyltransferase
MNEVLLYESLRTPRGAGKPGGALANVPPATLLADLLRELVARTGLDTARVGEAVIGCVTQQGEQAGNVGRIAALEAGWSDAVSCATVNHYCASSLWAFGAAAARVAAGDQLAVAGGVESMSRVPMASDRPPFIVDVATARRLGTPPMGVSADAIATLHGIAREEAESYAAQSQHRAAHARAAGYFDRSLVPVRGADGAVLLDRDETIRPGASVAQLLSMPPYFAAMGEQWADALVRAGHPELGAIDHFHHAGNSPAMADGASVTLLGRADAAGSVNVRPRARVLATATHASDHLLALHGALGATRKALARAGLDVGDIDLFEVNEAFAAPMLAYLQELGIDAGRCNVNGGAIALGHAMGATGTTLVGMLADELERRGLRRGVAAASGALGLGAAAVIETPVN